VVGQDLGVADWGNRLLWTLKVTAYEVARRRRIGEKLICHILFRMAIELYIQPYRNNTDYGYLIWMSISSWILDQRDSYVCWHTVYRESIFIPIGILHMPFNIYKIHPVYRFKIWNFKLKILMIIMILCKTYGSHNVYTHWLYRSHNVYTHWLYRSHNVCTYWLYRSHNVCTHWLYRSHNVCTHWLYLHMFNIGLKMVLQKPKHVAK